LASQQALSDPLSTANEIPHLNYLSSNVSRWITGSISFSLIVFERHHRCLRWRLRPLTLRSIGGVPPWYSSHHSTWARTGEEVRAGRHSLVIDLARFLNESTARRRGHARVMEETHFRAIWLSDIHLGTRSCKAGALLDFLDACDCEYLYLVGDIIDFWKLKRAPYWPQIHSDVIRKVLSKAHAGTVVMFVPGNHDEYIRRFCDLQLGNMFITREAVHRTADGRVLLILHGDEFDGVTRCHRWVALLGDIGYELLIVLNRWLNDARRVFGLGYFSLAAYVKWKVKRAMMFVCDFEAAVAREAARRGTDGVVCGHIH